MSNMEEEEIDSEDEFLSAEEENFGENSNGTLDTTAFTEATRAHLREIYDIMESRQEVNYKNALEFNQEMLKRLKAVRENIAFMQAKISERYASNEDFLKDNLKAKRSKHAMYGKICRGDTFFIKGSIYFKDINRRNAPNNDDYFYRRAHGEMFPMDFELTSRHFWSITDKVAIIKGVKEQIFEDKNLRNSFKKNEKLVSIIKKIGGNLKIDWMQMSMHNLKYRHSPTSCQTMFEVYLHPDLKSGSFTNEENERLAKAAEKFNFQNWAAIAAEVGQRSDFQCFLHFYTTPSFRQPYERWDKSADDLLIKAVDKSKCNGVINWSHVWYLFPHKSKTSLQQRYHNVLNPAISHAPFTGEEDLLLLAAVKEYGNNFAKFPRSLFPNRSTTQLRSRYYNTLATRHIVVPWTIEDDRILLKFVEDHGMLWKQCSELMEHRHTRVGCRQRYMVIQKHKQNNANFKLEQIQRRPLRMFHSCVTPDNWINKIEELRANPLLSVEATTMSMSKRKKQQQLKFEAALPDQEEPPQKRKRQTKKPVYVERLRHWNLMFHNFLKYSHNFRFGEPLPGTPVELFKIESQQAIDRLGFHMPNSGLSKSVHQIDGDVDLALPNPDRVELLNAIKQRMPPEMVLEPDGQQLTPNYSTLVALRALCVLNADTSNAKKATQKKNESTAPNILKTEEAKLCNDAAVEIKIEPSVVTTTTASSILDNKYSRLSPEELNNVPAIQRFRQRFHALFYQAACMSRLHPSSFPNKSFNVPSSVSFEQQQQKPEAIRKDLQTFITSTTTTTRKISSIKAESELNKTEGGKRIAVANEVL